MSEPARGARWAIALAARLVPRRHRAEWRREWEGEAAFAGRRLPVHELALASFRDALWLLCHEEAAGPLEWRRAHRGLAPVIPVPSDGGRGDALAVRILSDARFALRRIGRTPRYAGLVVLLLALGIGATIAVATLVETVLFRPLPYAHADGVVRALAFDEGKGQLDWASWREVQSWRRAKSFEGVAASTVFPAVWKREGGALRIQRGFVSENYFELLGVRGQLGASLALDEDGVVVSHRLWRREWGSSPDALGRFMNLDGKVYEIRGVAPETLYHHDLGGASPDVWIAQSLDRSVADPDFRIFTFFGRLRTGVDAASAQNELTGLEGALGSDAPRLYAGFDARVEGLRESLVAPMRSALFFLLGAVLLVLLVIATNLSLLVLTRTLARRRELAVHVALGARDRELGGGRNRHPGSRGGNAGHPRRPRRARSVLEPRRLALPPSGGASPRAASGPPSPGAIDRPRPRHRNGPGARRLAARPSRVAGVLVARKHGGKPLSRRDPLRSSRSQRPSRDGGGSAHEERSQSRGSGRRARSRSRRRGAGLPPAGMGRSTRWCGRSPGGPLLLRGDRRGPRASRGNRGRWRGVSAVSRRCRSSPLRDRGGAGDRSGGGAARAPASGDPRIFRDSGHEPRGRALLRFERRPSLDGGRDRECRARAPIVSGPKPAREDDRDGMDVRTRYAVATHHRGRGGGHRAARTGGAPRAPDLLSPCPGVVPLASAGGENERTTGRRGKQHRAADLALRAARGGGESGSAQGRVHRVDSIGPASTRAFSLSSPPRQGRSSPSGSTGSSRSAWRPATGSSG